MACLMASSLSLYSTVNALSSAALAYAMQQVQAVTHVHTVTDARRRRKCPRHLRPDPCAYREV